MDRTPRKHKPFDLAEPRPATEQSEKIGSRSRR